MGKKPVRILQMVNSLHFGGLQSFIMNVYHNIDRSQIQFDFIVIPEAQIDLYDEVRQLGARIFVCLSINLRIILSTLFGGMIFSNLILNIKLFPGM